MREQFKLFETTESPLSGPKGKEDKKEDRRKKRIRLPDAGGYDIIGGYAEITIRSTREKHTCCICGSEIPIGSPAKEVIEVVDGKLMVHRKEYAHLRGQCPPPAD